MSSYFLLHVAVAAEEHIDGPGNHSVVVVQNMNCSEPSVGGDSDCKVGVCWPLGKAKHNRVAVFDAYSRRNLVVFAASGVAAVGVGVA